MTSLLTIEANWELLERGASEERACFCELGIAHDGVWLTRAEDLFVNRLRDKVHLSAYRLAEWFAWNWWRLRWEPRRQADDWPFAHRMATIGGGYVWPNITVFSDGERVVMLAKPTQRHPSEPLHYIADLAAFMPTTTFESALDQFFEQVRGQLRAERIVTTNLDRIWDDVLAERSDATSTSLRRFEALLGFDPDQGEASVLEGLMGDATSLGERAMNEVAADHVQGHVIPTGSFLRETAKEKGFVASPSSAVRLASGMELPKAGEVAAWVRGAKAAKALRQQEHLGAIPVSNSTLSQMAGVHEDALTCQPPETAPLSFALDDSDTVSHVVLRSKWEVGRRFDLARLLGDRIAASDGKLFPATRAYTYRQKLQRSFAAEFLCPFEALEALLCGDYSEEKQHDAAGYFSVSELMISTILVNHGRIEGSDVEKDPEVTSAA